MTKNIPILSAGLMLLVMVNCNRMNANESHLISISEQSFDAIWNNRITFLKQSDIDRATKVIIDLGPGTIHPDHWWTCTITAEPTKVHLHVVIGLDSQEAYNQTFKINTLQWKVFKDKLKKSCIKNVPIEVTPDGGHLRILEVYDNSNLLFHSYEPGGLTYEGNIIDNFSILFPKGEAQDILADPSILFDK